MGRFDDGGGDVFATLIPYKFREIEACPYSNSILSAEQKRNLDRSISDNGKPTALATG